MTKRVNTSGFTLVELMIVVFIVGIMAGIAAPIYSNYVAKAHFYEGVNLAQNVKNKLSEYHGLANSWPTSHHTFREDGYVTAPDAYEIKYVSMIKVQSGGDIRIQYTSDASEAIAGKDWAYVVVEEGGPGGPEWECRVSAPFLQDPVDKGMLPSVCLDMG